MEKLSPKGPVARVPAPIDAPPHWADHHVLGRAILPAVEAMRLLAVLGREYKAGLDTRCMKEAAFDRFLELPPCAGRIDALCEMEALADGGLRTSLLTRTASKSGLMSRVRTHARLDFYAPADLAQPAALDLAAALEGMCYSVEPELIYKELVPLGPAFQTIRKPLRLSAEGALAVLRAPESVAEKTDPRLGSPFILDGAFHAACVWAQRFTGIVAFPVGIAQRVVATPTTPGSAYVCRIFPLKIEPALLTFDIWILDEKGRLFERLEGVRMRDVSGGKLKAPDWIRDRDGQDFKRLAAHSAALAVIDRSTLTPFAKRCLSERERARTAKMGQKRLVDYLSARLACKLLFRKLSGDDRHTPACEIATLAEDGVRPLLPVTNGNSFYCSVSHDGRFAVAVASGMPVGVDVETLDEKVLKSMELFMHGSERRTVMASALGPVGAAMRVWTTKEAVAKMLNIALADAWERTQLGAIEEKESLVRIKNYPESKVVHETVDDHLITLVYGQQ